MNRFKQIDILRATAVLLVLGRHLQPCPYKSSAILHHLTWIWSRGGWIGVDLFFVLSGFLVSGLLFREHEKFGELHLGHFLIRRGFKIYPPFWIMIGTTVVVLIWRHKEFSGLDVASELLFVQNYGHKLWSHTWSLAVEEHFYLLLALGAFVLARRRSARPFAITPWVFLVVAVACLALRVLGSLNHTLSIFQSHVRLDSLFFGVLLSYLFHTYPTGFLSVARRFRLAFGAIGLLFLLPAFCFPLESTPAISTFGLTLFYLGSGGLLVAALGFNTPTSLLARAAAYTGSHSYSIYLWHVMFAAWGTDIVHRLLSVQINWFMYAAFYLAGSLLFGIGMAILIEFPVLRMRDRFFPSRGKPLSTNDATGFNNASSGTSALEPAGGTKFVA